MGKNSGDDWGKGYEEIGLRKGGEGRCTSDISDIIPNRFKYNGIPRAANFGFPRELLTRIERYKYY